ncbi:BglG family transcription antiterminator [Globicatella sulfidifaciens]|uniref:Transcriptional antiterminator, BglG family n=1 Tax=Globicatella sulfidifaciens DSM 15739 TaxID=1121925 RepID=A0A1T4MD71_9LACT|nr:BglG family transcription antiterminator [Globicatella sulfidifaciens]SJZ64728.1 transcriptional antiterminator, BglG family [Globicatella sulfidifaciens DSM 15739]
MLSKKEVSLLECLLKNKTHYLSSAELAKEIDTSDRTARKYLQQLAQTIAAHGARLISKPGNGYLLEITHALEFEIFWQETLTSKKSMTDITQVEESTDRQHYVLNKLFFNDAPLLFDDLADELYISKTTLTNVLNDIRQQVQGYGLQLLNNKDGIRIEGVESDIRHFMMDYFFIDTFDDSMFAFVGGTLLSEINFAEITIVVIDECRDALLKLSDYVVHNLVLHIALMIKRIRTGYSIKEFKVAPDIQKSKEYEVALRILYRLETAFNVKFPIEEANYIALHLKVKQTQLTQEVDKSKDEQNSLNNQILNVLEAISQEIEMNLVTDTVLINGLTAHFHPLIIRLKNKIQLSNPLVEEIKTKFPEILAITKKYFAKMPLLEEQELLDDEWAYIAIHVLAAIERDVNRNKLQVLVVCATGTGSAMMLKNRLENEFGGSIKIVDVVGYYEVNEERLKGIDLIISSINLSNLLFLTPVVHVSVFLTSDEVREIRQYIRTSSTRQNEPHQKVALEKIKAEQIAKEIFSKEKFVYFEEIIDKNTALEQMILLLNEAEKPDFKDQMMHQLGLRETYSPVVYGERLAFPHPTVPMSLTEQVVVGICKEPLYWSEEHPSVRFIFLLSPSKGSNEKMKYISPCLVDFVNNEMAQALLLQQPDYKQLVNIFISLLQK